MAGPRQLLGLLFTGLAVTLAEDTPKAGITLNLKEDEISLHCTIASNGEKITWKKDGYFLEMGKDVLQVDAPLDNLRGIYTCVTESEQKASLQVFFRMCENCIQMDAATLTGLLVASMVATVFLALAVSKIAAQEPSRLSRASDKQNLLANNQLYQLRIYEAAQAAEE